MLNTAVWAGRCAVALIVALALVGLIERTSIHVRGDHLMHAFFSYSLTLALSASFPRARTWVVATAVVAAGAVLEVIQGLGYLAGDMQAGDLVSDAIGAGLAVAPILMGELRKAYPERRPRRR